MNKTNTDSPTDASLNKGGRPAKGSLYYVKSGWRARLTVTQDGEKLQKSFDLKTHDERVAKIKLKRLVAEQKEAEAAEAPTALEESAQDGLTFAEAAAELVDRQVRDGQVTTARDRESRLERFINPEIGHMAPADIRPYHVESVLRAVRDQGYAFGTIEKTKNDVSALLRYLWKLEMIPENVCAKVELPDAQAGVTARSKKERATLTDEELQRYLSWQHPDSRFRMSVLERQVMACVSRCFGGLRTGDLHALRWESFNLPTVHGDGSASLSGFETGLAPRKKGSSKAKGARPQRLIVAQILRPVIRDWWERIGRPMSGLIFPQRRGEKAGVGEKNITHADAFRADLRRAFGVDAQRPSTKARGSKRGPLNRLVWVEGVREMTSREKELFTETAYSRPVDFHSLRRAYSQALADAGVNSQQAKFLAGHSTSSAHDRYLQNTTKAREIPEAALPQVSALLMQEPEAANLQNTDIYGGRSKIRTSDICRVKAVLYR